MTIKEITDRGVWDHFWETHAPEALFQSWLWGEVVKKQSLPLVRFGLYDGSKLVGIFQVVTVRARRGTYLHVRQGPILLKQWSFVTNFLKDQARRERASFVRISPPLGDTDANRQMLKRFGMLPAATHEMDAQRRWVLDITRPEEMILSGMRKTTRYEIKRAMKEGVIIEKTEDVSSFFDLYGQTADRHGFVPHKGIREEFDVFSNEHGATMFLGKHRQKAFAAAIILFLGHQAIYHHGASIPNHFGASYLLQWEAIREAKRRGMKTYNFWGIAPPDKPNHPWRGITLFKTGFGGQEVRTIHTHDLPISPRYYLTRSIEIWERLRRGY